MRVLVVFAHPVETSYGAALKDRIIASLSPRHEIDLLDLHAEGFDPVMSREERLGYHEIPQNQAPVADHVRRLLAAEAVVFCFPAWTFGPPAILKGWFDRVMLPGVAIHIREDGRVDSGLTHLQKVAGVVTYGQTRFKAFLMGDYPRKLIRRLFRRGIGWSKPIIYLTHYAMNVSTDQSRAAFLDRVGREMGRF